MKKELINLNADDWAIYQRIKDLYSSYSREMQFLEYKLQFQNSNHEFVKDVLAMANAHTEYDRYIIYGVKDPNEKCEFDDKFVGVNEDINQDRITQILDFAHINKTLSNYVHLKEINVQDRITPGGIKDITLIIIHIENVPLKPFFLTEDYKSEKNASHILEEDFIDKLQKAIDTLDKKNKQFGQNIPPETMRKSMDNIRAGLKEVIDEFATNFYEYTYKHGLGLGVELQIKGPRGVHEKIHIEKSICDKKKSRNYKGIIRIEFMDNQVSDDDKWLQIYSQFVHIFKDEPNRKPLIESLEKTLDSFQCIEMERYLAEYTEVTELIEKLNTELSNLRQYQNTNNKTKYNKAKQAMISRLQELENKLSIETLEAHVIYTRHGATTAVATDDDLELMFRERLGIDISARERAFVYLRNVQDWTYDEKNQFIFCLNDPDYKIKEFDKAKFEISEDVKEYIKEKHKQNNMQEPSKFDGKTYYIELKGCDIKIWLDAIVIDNKIVIPNIDVNSSFPGRKEWRDCNPEVHCNDYDIPHLSHRGAINFCKIVQLHYNKTNNNDNEIDIEKEYTIHTCDLTNDTYHNDKNAPYDMVQESYDSIKAYTFT